MSYQLRKKKLLDRKLPNQKKYCINKKKNSVVNKFRIMKNQEALKTRISLEHNLMWVIWSKK